MHEWNQFCSGEHPAFNGRNNSPLVKFDGSKNCKELRLRSHEQHGLIYRQDSCDINDAVMVTGNHSRVKNITDLGLIKDDDVEIKVHKDKLDIFQSTMETVKKFSTMIIKEDYASWKNTQFNPKGAKPLLIDQADYLT